MLHRMHTAPLLPIMLPAMPGAVKSTPRGHWPTSTCFKKGLMEVVQNNSTHMPTISSSCTSTYGLLKPKAPSTDSDSMVFNTFNILEDHCAAAATELELEMTLDVLSSTISCNPTQTRSGKLSRCLLSMRSNNLANSSSPGGRAAPALHVTQNTEISS